RHADHVVAAVRPADRFPLLRLVELEVALRDEPAVPAHVLGDEACGFAAVEAVAPLVRDALQRAGEVRLTEELALLVGDAVLRELLHTCRIRRHVVEYAGE